jgi:hypothetical protein
MNDPRDGDDDERRLANVLGMADIAPLAQGRTIVLDRGLETAFVVDRSSGDVRIGRAALGRWPGPRIVVRHALELSVLLEICGRDPVLCGLSAARTGALFASLECDAGVARGPDWYDAAFTSDSPPELDRVPALWAAIAKQQPDVANANFSATASLLATVWPLLGPAEYLMGKGGDGRLMLDPETGLNAYGCSPRPRPWAVTFASSTASSISERGYAAAETVRRRMLRDAIEGGIERSERNAAENTRRALGECYQLSAETRIVLVPSGTDGELCAVAVAHLGDPGTPLTNILVAAEETGTGVPLAATGRHFATRTARGADVSSGTVIEGFPADIRLETVSGRSERGAVRAAAAVNEECKTKIAAALAQNRRVLLHVMDQSKTGLRMPDFDPAGGDMPPTVDVVVDSCQARLAAASIREYLQRGFMVLVTGSKFFTGPPFAGALLLPPAIAARIHAPSSLPAGLAQYCSRFDWPETAAVADQLTGRANVGLVLRWEAALAEMRAFLAVDAAEVENTLGLFARRIQSAIRENPDLRLHEVPALPNRAWDALPTVFTFSILTSAAHGSPRRPLTPEEAREIYLWLNSDVSHCLPPSVPTSERALAAGLFHLGQPVAIATESGERAGALRISAGARLVSGEPSLLTAFAHRPPMARVEREISDALASLEKISLILRHVGAVRAHSPRPRYETT